MLRKCNNVEEVIKCIREFYHSFDSSNYSLLISLIFFKASL